MAATRPLKSVYIHIPFCKSKCHYCNFISFSDKNSYINKYFKALEREMLYCLESFPNKTFQTVYIGGGTPSLADGFYYEKILSLLNLSETAEITIEINPGTVNRKYFESLRRTGINRVSIGIQSFDDNILRLLNRPHSATEAISTVEDAKKAGFNNISIDLIYGLPGQKLSSWEKTLSQALMLNVNHISTYGLKIEEDTEFFYNPPDNLPDEDMTSQIYLKTIEILEKNGFIHYEISNFAKPQCKSKHNLVYWNNEEYFGFGLAAHGYVNGFRYSNLTDIESYINNPFKKESRAKLTTGEILEEAIFLGLRLRKGIDIQKFKKIYSISLAEKYKKVIEKYTAMDLMNFDGNTLKLTKQGMLLSNNILADFLI